MPISGKSSAEFGMVEFQAFKPKQLIWFGQVRLGFGHQTINEPQLAHPWVNRSPRFG